MFITWNHVAGWNHIVDIFEICETENGSFWCTILRVYYLESYCRMDSDKYIFKIRGTENGSFFGVTTLRVYYLESYCRMDLDKDNVDRWNKKFHNHC